MLPSCYWSLILAALPPHPDVRLGVLLTAFPSITVHPCLFVEVFDTIRAPLSPSSRYLVFFPSHSRVAWFEMHAVTPLSCFWWRASCLGGRDQRLSTWASNMSAVTGISHCSTPDKDHLLVKQPSPSRKPLRNKEKPLDSLTFNIFLSRTGLLWLCCCFFWSWTHQQLKINGCLYCLL